MWAWAQSIRNGLGRGLNSLGDRLSSRREPLDIPDRGQLTSEKVKTAPRIPAFLPYFDEQQNVGETQQMRLAYRRMLSDPNVKAALFGKIIAVMGLELKVRSASDHARFKEHAEFAEWTLTKRLKGGMPALAWDILSGGCIDGYSLNEKVWAIQDDAGGSRWRMKKVLRDLKAKDVNQDCVLLIDEFKNPYAVRGLRFNAGEEWSIKDFLLYSHLGLFGNPTGMSDLRAAYGRWWMLDTVIKLRAIGAEKRATPFVWGSYPNAAQQTKVEQALANVSSQNWAAVPDAVKLQVLDISGSSNEYFSSFRKDLQEEIFLAIQGATLQALTGGLGTMRGASAVHKDTADLFKWHLSSAIMTCLNDHECGLIPDLINQNYQDVTEYPHATLSGIDDAELAESLKIDEGLVSIGFPPSARDIGERYGRKKADPEDPEDQLQPPQPPVGPGGFPGMGGGDGPPELDDILSNQTHPDQPDKLPSDKGQQFAEWEEAKHKRDHGQFSKTHGSSGTTDATNGDHPQGTSDPQAKTEAKADKIAASVQQKTSGVLRRLGAVGKWMKDKTQAVYKGLERRYGRKQAIAIFAAGHVLGFTPPFALVPGSTLIGMAPFAALAEVYLQAKNAISKHADEAAHVLAPQEVKQVAKRMLDHLAQSWKEYQRQHNEWESHAEEWACFVEDASGHEHKGKGPGGGQFVSTGGDDGEERPEEPEDDDPVHEAFKRFEGTDARNPADEKAADKLAKDYRNANIDLRRKDDNEWCVIPGADGKPQIMHADEVEDEYGENWAITVNDLTGAVEIGDADYLYGTNDLVGDRESKSYVQAFNDPMNPKPATEDDAVEANRELFDDGSDYQLEYSKEHGAWIARPLTDDEREAYEKENEEVSEHSEKRKLVIDRLRAKRMSDDSVNLYTAPPVKKPFVVEGEAESTRKEKTAGKTAKKSSKKPAAMSEKKPTKPTNRKKAAKPEVPEKPVTRADLAEFVEEIKASAVFVPVVIDQ